MWFFGPPRTDFGKWLDNNGISQSDLSRVSGVSVKTISDLARGRTKKPTRLTARKLIKAIRLYDAEVSMEDFWG